MSTTNVQGFYFWVSLLYKLIYRICQTNKLGSCGWASRRERRSESKDGSGNQGWAEQKRIIDVNPSRRSGKVIRDKFRDKKTKKTETDAIKNLISVG